jgi:tRNA(His) 5'-end guanylyltransferase
MSACYWRYRKVIDRVPKTTQLVDPDLLQEEILRRFKMRQDDLPNLQVTVDTPVFQDGFWRSIVHRGESQVKAEEYATALAEVEELLFDDFGVNVVLVPASD